MDDPRLLQFFVDPQQAPQRRYEAIRAAVVDKQPLQAVAERFGFAYGTVRNLVAQFRACIREGRTPPFSWGRRADGPLVVPPMHAPIRPPSPTVDCSLSIACRLCARAWPGSSCSCRWSPSSASIASCALRAIPARA